MEIKFSATVNKLTDSSVSGKDRRLQPLRLGEARQQRAIWLVELNLKLHEDFAGHS